MRDWLVLKRKKAGLTQTQTARAAGLSQSGYANIEAGNRSPKIATARKIASALGFNWQEFYEEVPQPAGTGCGG